MEKGFLYFKGVNFKRAGAMKPFGFMQPALFCFDIYLTRLPVFGGGFYAIESPVERLFCPLMISSCKLQWKRIKCTVRYV